MFFFGEINISSSIRQAPRRGPDSISSQIFIVNIYTNIYLHEYSHDIRPDNQGNTPGMDKEVWQKPETRLDRLRWGLKVWEPLHVLRRDGKHVGWTWLVGSARAMTAAALHFRGRCRGGAPSATRAAQFVNTFFFFDINVLRLRLATAESTD